MRSVPSPSSDQLPEVFAHEIPQELKNVSIVCQMRGHVGVAVDARLFSRLIAAQVKLLEAIDKQEARGPLRTTWCLTEAAIVGEHASFTLTGYKRDWYRKALRAAQKKARITAVAAPKA